MLLNYEVVPPSDVKNILRVLAIQASAPRTEFQLKIVQILLQLANSLSVNAASAQYLTEATVGSFLNLCFKMSKDSRSNISVTGTALSTARQIITIVMDAATAGYESSIDDTSSSSSSSLSAQLLVRDLCFFCRAMPGEWIKGER